MSAEPRKDKPEGPYTLWWQTDGFWTFQDFPTLKEAVDGVNGCAFGSAWVIQKPAVYEVREVTEEKPSGDALDTPGIWLWVKCFDTLGAGWARIETMTPRQAQDRNYAWTISDSKPAEPPNWPCVVAVRTK